jgi:gluconate 2-dehydrogenase gamma chain
MSEPTRRSLLTSTAFVALGVALPGLPVLAVVAPAVADTPTPIPEAYGFFTPAEAAFIDAATARIIPTDAEGPGAHEAGVVTFIDRQLNGDYGRAVKWYMQGPYGKSADGQGYQSSFTPAEAYRAAIKATDDYCRNTYQGNGFADLTPDQQDSTLKAMETDGIEIPGIGSKDFFNSLLRQNTLEGFFSDPLYGGNRDMVGWRMIGFPGARGDFVDYMDTSDQPYPLPPVGVEGHREMQMRDPNSTETK